MKAIPKLTVLMSVYNGLDFLEEAVGSILDQTFTDFELLVINDGSTEPVHDVIESFRDQRILIHDQENMGLTRSLNKGLDLARSEYVARMDSDDVSLPERLEAQVAVLNLDPKMDLVGSFFDIVDGDGRLIEHKELITDATYRLWRLQFHNNYGHGTVMFRKRAVLAAGKYDQTLKYAQDYDLWSRISLKDNTAVIPKALYKYRLISRSAQASVRNYDEQLATAIRISDRNLQGSCPELSAADCAELRALYWNFQIERFSERGLEFLPKTFVRFCKKFRIEDTEQKALASRIAIDVENSAGRAELSGEAVAAALSRLESTIDQSAAYSNLPT